MSDLLQTGAHVLADHLATAMSQTVTYSRGSKSVSIAATIGRSTFEVSDAAGAALLMRSKDVIVRAADLKLDSVAITPERGDRIVWTNPAKQVETLEVTASPNGGECFTQPDGYRYQYRIFTKRIS